MFSYENSYPGAVILGYRNSNGSQVFNLLVFLSSASETGAMLVNRAVLHVQIIEWDG